MNTPKRAVIGKIRKLMNMTDPARGASQGEIDNAMRMIDKLMRDNNLSSSEVMAPDDRVIIERAEGVRVAKAKNFTKILVAAVCCLCETHAVRRRATYQAWEEYVFIGTKHDAALSRETFQILLEQITKGARSFDTSQEKRQFSEGFSMAVIKRCKSLAETRAGEAGALVFVGRKESAIKDEMEKMDLDGDETKAKIPDSEDYTPAFYAGHVAGKNADLKPRKKIETAQKRLSL